MASRAEPASRPEHLVYLGHQIVVLDERDLAIYTPDGCLIAAGRMEVSGARRIIRGYRKGDH